ncbi:transcriptional regulator [Neobacillus piezotolerans]|uniref:Transcriptional regulator n=1 Tax=Neobacillus piezotolerans TaxID=2259171 RepID=A0A3D8GLX5_9BACI|nr:ArpU family phage packaging/lysis transcriptional regulator [Neobacillus piezotolerans]RDU35475.1 transcriptional regulator [Neobacillus piezotolerans]
MSLLKSLTTAEKKKIQKAVEKELERYRIYSTTAFFKREANLTTSYVPRYHGSTNQTGDSTAAAAIHNADAERKRIEHCQRIDEAVNRLPEMERKLIQERYMDKDSDYMTDLKYYSFVMDPPVSQSKFNCIRQSAMIKLALMLGIDAGVDISRLL